MRSHRGGEPPGALLLFQRTSFLGTLASRRVAPSPLSPSPLLPKRWADIVAHNTNRLGPQPRASYRLGLKLFSLSGRFVRVCKTVAKLLAAHSSWTLEMHRPQNSTGSNVELASFFIRYAARATIPARNRESGFPSRCRATHVTFLRRWTDRQYDGECPPSY